MTWVVPLDSVAVAVNGAVVPIWGVTPETLTDRTDADVGVGTVVDDPPHDDAAVANKRHATQRETLSAFPLQPASLKIRVMRAIPSTIAS
jgi:hypothetical protein